MLTALVVAVVTLVIVVAVVLVVRGTADPAARYEGGRGAGHVIGGTPPAAPPSGLGMPYPPPVPPTLPAPAADDLDPERPHHRR
ncbi:hypothetical protein ACIPSE_22415 [Streptomyces sp. NPDC090106]|uniref:hypothetical protein n=1 Tax=Streptomyces sp. NPDC090106 TaxID=3365946 RepID=UPI00381619AA